MTRHIITQALIAASAFTVLAAAPSAMAASAKFNSAKVKTVKAKKLKTAVKLADNRSTLRNRSSILSNRNSFNRRTGLRDRVSTRSLLGRSTFGNSLLGRSTFGNSFRTSSIIGGNRGFFTPYRSSIGINFSFGTPGFSQYRWASSPYSLYRTSYGSLGSYKTRTVCHRVTLQGWHRGHRVPISVKQCSNPWDGSYIIQGSERLLTTRW